MQRISAFVSNKIYIFILLIVSCAFLSACFNQSVTCGNDAENLSESDTAFLQEAKKNADSSYNEIHVIAVSASGGYMLALLDDGTLLTWGGGYIREESSGEWVFSGRYVPTKILEDVIHADVGLGHYIAITSDGVLWAWGANHLGQIGDGTFEKRELPAQIMENVTYAAIAPARSNAHAIAAPRTYVITEDGRLWAWGQCEYGDPVSILGDGTRRNRNIPVQIMENIISIEPTHDGGRAIDKDGSVWWWGINWYFDEASEHWSWHEIQLYPAKVYNTETVFVNRRGNVFDFEIDKDGALWAWGQNLAPGDWIIAPLVGDGTTEQRQEPIMVMENVRTVSVVADTVFAITEKGHLYAWGYNSIGQLGDGTTEPRLSPVRIMDNVVYVTSTYHEDHRTIGFLNTFVITADGCLWGWGGHGFSPSIGDGSTEHRLSPVQILPVCED